LPYQTLIVSYGVYRLPVDLPNHIYTLQARICGE
jgi:hypothetical protein